MKKFFAIILLLLNVSCNLLQPPPDLAWEHDADALIIRVTEGGGLVSPATGYNEIPRAQVWGNGRIVWQTLNEGNNRQVWQDQLSEAEMADLLQTFADKGFFRMDGHYRPKEQIYDSSTTSLRLTLLADSYRVSEYHSGAPAKFHQLAGLLASGAGKEGSPYVPQSGYLTAVPLKSRDNTSTLPTWDASARGLDLTDATGIWIEGDVLAHAWEIVNLKYWSPLVVQGGDLYELYVQLPELTGQEPR